MKVLTVRQPYALLIANNAKPFEFRGHAAPASVVGQRIGINAAARPLNLDEVRWLLSGLEAGRTSLVPDLALPALDRLLAEPEMAIRGAIVCTAILGAPRDRHDLQQQYGRPVNDSPDDRHASFGWPLTDIEAVMPPEPHRGQQGWSQWGGR